MFSMALFPQFIDHNQALLGQFMIMLGTFMSLSFICLLAYAHLAEKSSHRFQQSPYYRYIAKLFGGLFIAAGLFLGLSSRAST